MNEASKATKLTKKAIEYYVEQGLLFPAVLGNGYRDFSSGDIACLRKILVLRKLGIGTHAIKAVLSGDTGSALQHISLQKELDIGRQQAKKDVLDHLIHGAPYESVAAELETIERHATITEKLLHAFPGYYGRFVCLHFARFLGEPIETPAQQAAYEQVVSFLDNMPPLDLPKDLQDYLIEGTAHISAQSMQEMVGQARQWAKNPEDFLSSNKDFLDAYLAYKQSDSFKSTPAYRLQCVLKRFNQASGYNNVFLPAMQALSPSYAAYCADLEHANEKFVAQYPDFAKQVGFDA